MIEAFASPEIWLSLVTLTFLEIILGVDNVVFVSVAAGRLPEERRRAARGLGIYTGALMRVLMLFALIWLTGLTQATLFHAPEFLRSLADPNDPEKFVNVTLEDLILLVGGLFLLWKGTSEIHHAIEGDEEERVGRATAGFGAIVLQMTLINVVFSLDSVLTAVGMTKELGGEGSDALRLLVMVIAVVVSTLIMVASAKAVSGFLERNPTTKMLALAFILLVGVALIADGLGFHIPRGYLYFAIAFSLAVEALNVMQRNARRAAAAKEAGSA